MDSLPFFHLRVGADFYLSIKISTDFFEFRLNLTILFLFLKEKVYKKKIYKEGWEHISPPSLTFHSSGRDAAHPFISAAAKIGKLKGGECTWK